MSTTIITGRLGRLAEQLGDLRIRLKQAAQFEVAQAISDALAETTKTLICGPSHPRPRDAYESEAWEDPWQDPYSGRPSWSHDRINKRDLDETAASRGFPARSALLAGFTIARWALMRTGQPTVALGLAGLTVFLILVIGDRISPFLDVCTAAHELLDDPKPRP